MNAKDEFSKDKENIFLSVLLNGWNNLLDDYDKWESHKVFWHDREEDIRTYLFHKIMIELEQKKIDWWDTLLRTEVTYQGKRLDLALGYNHKNYSYDVGVELKPNLKKKSVMYDINKLKALLVNGHLKTGVFLGIGKHKEHWPQIVSAWFEDSDINLEENDNGNNYWMVRTLTPISVLNQIKHFDAMQIVLRDM